MFDLPCISLSRSISGGRGSRIYGPTNLEDQFRIGEVEDEIKPVLAKIEMIYSRVDLREELLDNGFCFGLLDPVSNILVNSLISTAFAGPQATRGEQVGEMNQRSLKGLIAFLTCLFPYLPEAEAVAYLGAAEADPIVAIVFIINRRGMRDFDFCSGTTVAAVETALRCAAVAAGHSDPEQLVLGWKMLSPRIEQFSYTLSDGKRRSEPDATSRRVLSMIKGGVTPNPVFKLEKSWCLAQGRFPFTQRFKDLPSARAAMKRMLLATIHGFYLHALVKLPSVELSSKYHHSILMGGYCYGPLDPVSNIIINTLWYYQNFPPAKQLVLDMISTECLWRVAARSLYGLVSFLCTRYPILTPDLAMQRLLVAGANLQAADPKLKPNATGRVRLDFAGSWQVGWAGGSSKMQRRAVESSLPSATVTEAYAAAATAAFHPDPGAQQMFLGSPDVLPRLEIASELVQQCHVMSARDIDFLSSLLQRCPSSVSKLHQQQEPAPTKLSKVGYAFISTCINKFWDKYERVSSKVATALKAYNKDRVHKYRLNVICGVNELVSGPEFSKDDEVRGYNPWTPFKYHHSHVNFLATGEDTPYGTPTFFFAECSNHGTDNAWCVPVNHPHSQAEHVRCIYCEHEGNRIVHPALTGFHGRDMEFEKVLRGEPLFYGADKECYMNDRIITNKIAEVDWVHPLADDYIYDSVDYDAAAELDAHELDELEYIDVC